MKKSKKIAIWCLIGLPIALGGLFTASYFYDKYLKEQDRLKEEERLKQEEERINKLFNENILKTQNAILDNSIILKATKTFKNPSGNKISEMSYRFSNIDLRINTNGNYESLFYTNSFFNSIYYKNDNTYILSDIKYEYIPLKDAVNKRIDSIRWSEITPTVPFENLTIDEINRLYVYDNYVSANVMGFFRYESFFKLNKDLYNEEFEIQNHKFLLDYKKASNFYSFDVFLEQGIIKWEFKNINKLNFIQSPHFCYPKVTNVPNIFPILDVEKDIIEWNQPSINNYQIFSYSWASRLKDKKYIGSFIIAGDKTFEKRDIISRLIPEIDLSDDIDKLYYIR